MKKVYVRIAPESNDLHINFRFKVEAYNIDRNFNFCRKLDEIVDNALVRMHSSLVKELFKKPKKEKYKPTKSTIKVKETTLIDIKFLRHDSIIVSNISFREMIHNSDDLSLGIMDEKFEVVVNEPCIIDSTLPISVLAGFIVYPSKMDMQFADLEYCLGEWYKVKNKNSECFEKALPWIKCGCGYFYESTVNDIGYFLKFKMTPGNAKKRFGLTVETISKNEVQAGPGRCPFEDRHLLTQKRSTNDVIRIVSYNILADLYTNSDYSRNQLFPYCPPHALRIEYRKQLVIKEILGYNADIICLQEVDKKVFNSDLNVVMEQHFVGLFEEKTSTSEGLATFFRKDRFDLIHSKTFSIGKSKSILPQFSVLWEKINVNEKLAKRITDRSTILQVTVLKLKNSCRYLLVANTHLYFHPDADHIRLLQVGLGMMFIEDTIRYLGLPEISLIFCGDFNSTPECGIYKFMTEKYVGTDVSDWKSCSQENVDDVTLTQPINIKSAYEIPNYTHFTQKFVACIDYIFYQCDSLEVCQVIPLPLEEELKRHTAIPSVVFPSDHISLVADLKFKKLN